VPQQREHTEILLERCAATAAQVTHFRSAQCFDEAQEFLRP